jgi:hypothetical protein
MKLKAALLVAVLTIGGCRLPHELTQAQTLSLIADALYGVDYACYSEWLDGPACTIVRHILDDATTAVEHLQGGWQAVAKAVLIREETPLPADSRIRPYLDALISVL